MDVLVITQNFQDAEKLGIVEEKIRNVEIHAIPINSALELVHKQDPFFVQILNECKPIYGEFYIKFLREVRRMLERAKVWLERAKADLKSAEILKSVVPADSVYHSQQAVKRHKGCIRFEKIKARYPLNFPRGTWDPLKAYSEKDAEK